MATTRRDFVWQAVATAGAVAVPSACTRTGVTGAAVAGSVESGLEPAYLRLMRRGELEERVDALWRKLESCELCARGCGANRLEDETGVCGTAKRIKVASAGPHFGEEPELVGDHGSGTVFFSRCNLLCCFCQNWEINHRGEGAWTTEEELAQVMFGLQRRGCHNINLVTPSHVVPHIVKAVGIAAERGLHLPLVYNTGGYDDLETIKALDGVVDIYLPDFKYQDAELAGRYSSGAVDYPKVAAAVISEMHRQVGDLQVDGRGVAIRGLIIRHLVMPNNVGGTDRFVQWVAQTLGPDTYVNLMAQYRPEHEASEYPKIGRRLTREEWREAVEWARAAGLTNLHV